MASLLEPGSYRAPGVDDAALVRAMLRVEVAWMHALAQAGAATPGQVGAVAAAAEVFDAPLPAAAVEAAGNPVLPLVTALREAVADEAAAALVHRGLTSQDVLDTALVLLARDALGRVVADLDRVAAALAALADAHRSSVMAGRTLTQYAVPVTFGLRAAQWLAGVLDAGEAVRGVGAALPVQCGGAAGTLALAGELVTDAPAAAATLAHRLGLRAPGLPWHTRRTPVTRLGDVLAETCDALGHLAGDVLVLGRPEIAEVREATAEGRGGSSTMPHKQNPVLAVLVRSAALQAPQLAAQLHLCAADVVDERPPGAWHAEWPAVRRLLALTVTAASQAAELVEGLDVDTAAMRRRADGAAAQLLSERGGTGGTNGTGDPAAYLGSAEAFVDQVLMRWEASRGGASTTTEVP
jgi:3-carboxy-cis,cis-muconate cycloisomerase